MQASAVHWRARPPLSSQVVITGGTRGLGFQLARAFLALGDDVCISGRAPGAVEAAAAKLRSEFPRCTVVGVPADAARDAEALSARAAAELGHIVSRLIG